MRSLLDAGELEDEHLAYQKKSRFAKSFPTIKAAAEEGLITIPMLADDQQFFRWVSFASENQRDAFVYLRDKQLSGFKFYSIPCVILPKDVPLSALAKIFETINRTGVRLDAFDLMVAKLYPSDFYLRDEWEQARGDFKLLQVFDVEGIEILKLIALMEHIRQLGQPGPTPVKGVRQSDVLQLDPDVVKEMWNLAVLSYHGALEFLHDRCSVVSSSLLPAKAMVLAVSCALRIDESHRQDFESDVERWFWAATFQ